MRHTRLPASNHCNSGNDSANLPFGNSTKQPSTQPPSSNTARNLPSKTQASEPASTSKYWDEGLYNTDAYFNWLHTFSATKAGEVFQFVGNYPSNIRSVPLVMELPKPGELFTDSFMKTKPAAMTRWEHVSTIYIIMPSLYPVGIAKTLALSHGHFPLTNLIDELILFSTSTFANNVTVHFIGCCSDYSDNHLYIRNNVKSVNLPWAQISSRLEHIHNKNGKDLS